MNIQWSDWFSLSEETVSSVPEKQGIYEIRTDYEINRLVVRQQNRNWPRVLCFSSMSV